MAGSSNTVVPRDVLVRAGLCRYPFLGHRRHWHAGHPQQSRNEMTHGGFILFPGISSHTGHLSSCNVPQGARSSSDPHPQGRESLWAAVSSLTGWCPYLSGPTHSPLSRGILPMARTFHLPSFSSIGHPSLHVADLLGLTTGVTETPRLAFRQWVRPGDL